MGELMGAKGFKKRDSASLCEKGWSPVHLDELCIYIINVCYQSIAYHSVSLILNIYFAYIVLI